MASAVDPAAYKEALILLGTAALIVPVVHRLKVSPILGFVAMGALLGPHLLGALAWNVPLLSYVTVSDSKEIAWLAELGVVFLLFVIGLELSPRRLITMRRLVFGLGTLQVLVTAAVLALAVRLMGFTPNASVLIGLALSLSSTAIVVELLAAQDRLASTTGRASVAVLLLQDLAVVPILFLVGVLGAGSGISVASGLAKALLQAAAVLAVIILIGKFLLTPLFRHVAATQTIELFTAATLFVVVGSGVLSATAGLSMAMGAFVGGLLLAETEFRKAVEATLAPFKGLLLGVFFFSVGMSIDVDAILSSPLAVLAATVCIIAVKALLFVPLARLFGVPLGPAVESALLLGPGGEFAFIIIGLAVGAGVVPSSSAALLLASVAMSMVLLPVLAPVGRLVKSRIQADPAAIEAQSLPQPPTGFARHALVVGYGRVGELVTSMLAYHGVPHLATDANPKVVANSVRGAERKVYFGDAKSPVFLDRCGIKDASVLIVTINNAKEIDLIVEAARSIAPNVPIISRARDAEHARRLYQLGVTDAVPETIEASLQLSEASLVSIGIPTGRVIASIHEKRDEFRSILQSAVTQRGAGEVRGLRAKAATAKPDPVKTT